MGTGRFGKIVKTIFLLLLFVTAFTACTAKQEENTAEVFNLPETAGVSESADSITADDNMTEAADNIVPVSYSERAAVTMEAAVLLKIEGAGHGFYGKDDLNATEEAITFINQYK